MTIVAMLAKSRFHNASGTRCQLDFVEIPSTLMEYFARDERVLESFSEHEHDGSKISSWLLERRLKAFHSFDNLELLNQIQHAIFDLKCHGDWSNVSKTSSFDDIYNAVQEQVSPIKSSKETSWACQFTHLYGYGSSYYSYALSRVFAQMIWQSRFKADPFDRKSGEDFRRLVLAPGGSVSGNAILGSYFKVSDPLDLLAMDDESSS